jgi:hypothetical protein
MMMLSKPSLIRISVLLAVVVIECAVSTIYIHSTPVKDKVLILDVAILLSAILVIWYRPIIRAGAFAGMFITLLSGFAAFGSLLIGEISRAIGIGSVFLLGAVMSIRKFRRLPD